MIKEAIYKLINKEDLTYEEAEAVMEEMMDGTATQAQMGGFLTALRIQGETIDEITAFAKVMREKGVKINPVKEVMDIVGTGGDEVGTFNISTTTAFVARLWRLWTRAARRRRITGRISGGCGRRRRC